MNITIKDTWDEVTLSEFLILKEIAESEDLSPIEKQVMTISILSGIEQSEFRNVDVDDIKQMFEKLTFLNEVPTAELKDYYTIGGVTYKFVRMVNQLTAGQFIDLNSYTKDTNLILDNTHQILSVILLPITKLNWKSRLHNWIYRRIARTDKMKAKLKAKGIGLITVPAEKYMQTPTDVTAENLLNNMKITDAMAISVFFCQLLGAFQNYIQTYLQQQAKREINSALVMSKTESPMIHQKLKELLDRTGFQTGGAS